MRGSKTDMPVTLEEAGVVIRDAVWDDLHVSFETFGQAFDSRPFHRGLPDDCCQCPHWGYVLRGSMKIIYKDREEIVKAGDAYYMQPGRNAIYEPGTQTIEFSPNDQFQAGMDVVMRNVEAMKRT